MIRAILIALALCGLIAIDTQAQSFWVAQPPSVDAKKPPKPPSPACDSFGWCDQGQVTGVSGSYTPVVPLSAANVRVYGNTNGSTDGDLWLRSCTWSTCGPATKVLDVTNPRDTYIRTSGVARGASGTYYAILYTGDGYPTQGGYSPSWATSPDGVTWTWHGPITLFGRNQSSAAALIVDEAGGAFACMAWVDIGNGLRLMHAPMPCMPGQWQSDGANHWPIASDGAPQFVTATRTQYGVHLIGAIGYPATAHRHIFSCTGLPPWTVVEQDAMTRNGQPKGTNLSFDGATIHALTAGRQFTLPARAFPC